MIRCAVACLLLLLAATGPADCGAWARGAGKTFTSLKGAVPSDERSVEAATLSLYGEYGLTSRLTLGSKYDRLDPVQGAAELFVRWNAARPDAPLQMAAELGVGLTLDYSRRVPVEWTDRTLLIAAVHAGRGFATRFGNGWVDIRLGGRFPLNEDPARGKFNALAGIDLTRLLAMIELRSDFGRNDVYATIGPAAALKLGDRLHLTAGIQFDAAGSEAPHIEIGTWFAF